MHRQAKIVIFEIAAACDGYRVTPKDLQPSRILSFTATTVGQGVRQVTGASGGLHDILRRGNLQLFPRRLRMQAARATRMILCNSARDA